MGPPSRQSEKLTLDLYSVDVPFSRTRHITNSFNAKREVKICRDGELADPRCPRRTDCSDGAELTCLATLQGPRSSLSQARCSLKN